MIVEDKIQQLQNLFELVNHSIIITDFELSELIKNDHYNELVKNYDFDESIIVEYLESNRNNIVDKKNLAHNIYFSQSNHKYKLHLEVKIFESFDDIFFVCFISIDNIIENYLGKAKDAFRYFADNSPFVVFICLNDKDWTALYVNEKVLDLTGYSKQDFLDNKISFGQILHEDDVESSNNIVQEAIKNKQSYNLKYRLKKKDGSIIWIEEHGSGVFHDDKLLFLQGNLLDITDKVMLEKRFNENKELYRNIFENSYTMMMIIDPDTLNIIELNNAACIKFGYTKKELIGKSIEVIHTLTSEEIKKIITSNFNSEKSAIIETKHRKRNGEVFNVEVFSSILKYQDEDTIFSIVTDITEKWNYRKQIEREKERLSMFIDATQDGFWEIDAINKTIDANDRYYEMLGYKKGEFPVDYEYKIEHVHPDDKNRYLEIIDKVYNLKINKNIQYRIRHKDGHYLWVHSLGIIKTDKNGEIKSIVGVTKDITHLKNSELQAKNNAVLYSRKNAELKKINVQLQKEIIRAEESDRLKTSFLALLSHELRTPLNSINGFSNLIKYETNISDIQSFAEIINQSGMNLLGIINDLLDISNIEIRQIELNYTTLPLNDFFDEIFDYLNQLLNNIYLNKVDKIEIIDEFKYRKENLRINTDKVKLMKVLKNIANNSVKFSDEGKIRYGFNIFENFVEFYFKDEGIGIDKDKLDTIFNAFTQSEDYLNREHGGLGLGLSIAKSYVKAFKGHLLLTSDLGKGTQVEVRLPRAVINN